MTPEFEPREDDPKNWEKFTTWAEALDEIGRLQRERDALLREHEAVGEDFFYQSIVQAHDEAARVLEEGAKK